MLNNSLNAIYNTHLYMCTHNHTVKMHLDSHQHLVLGRTQVVTLCQEDFAESAFTQLPLQNDVPALYMLDN